MKELLVNPFIATLAVLVGGVSLVGGGEALVRGASKIALGLKISPLVVGLTIVALCTSAPEMAVSFSSVFNGDPAVADVALGNVVGSNICNIMLILGVCALIKPLRASATIIRRDFPVCVALSLVTFVVALTCRDASGAFRLPQIFGVALLVAFVGYETVVVRRARSEEHAQSENDSESAASDAPEASQETATAPSGAGWLVAIVQTLLGLAFLVIGAQLFVDGAVSIARSLHVSELVIGLTLVALGTSLPELTVSVVATLRNQVDVALGNVVGSNVCNLLLVLGGTLALLPGGIAVQRQSAFVDIPVMLVSAALAAWFCHSKQTLERWEGALLLAGEIGYAAWLIH